LALLIFTIITIIQVNEKYNGLPIPITNVQGNKLELEHFQLYVYIGVGWIIYFVGIIFNGLYYAVHPSEVDLDDMKPKLHVYILGKEYPCCVGSKEDEKDEQTNSGTELKEIVAEKDKE